MERWTLFMKRQMSPCSPHFGALRRIRANRSTVGDMSCSTNQGKLNSEDTAFIVVLERQMFP